MSFERIEASFPPDNSMSPLERADTPRVATATGEATQPRRDVLPTTFIRPASDHQGQVPPSDTPRPSTDVPRDGTIPPADGANEQPRRKYYHVRGVDLTPMAGRDGKPDGQLSGQHPLLATVASTARRGANMAYVLHKPPGSTDVSYLASRTLVPPGADKTEATTRPDSDLPIPADDPMPTSWARIRLRGRAETEDVPSGDNTDSQIPTAQAEHSPKAGRKFRIHGLLEQATEPFTVVVDGRGVDSADLDSAITNMRQGERNRARAHQPTASREFARSREALERTLGKGAVSLSVAVGSVDASTTAELADIVAHTVLPDMPGIRWEPEVDDSGEIITYPTPEAALDRRRDTYEQQVDAIVDAGQFTETVRYDKNVPGLLTREGRVYAVDRRLPRGEFTVSLLDRIDPWGRTLGPLETTNLELKRHGLIVGGSGAGKTVAIADIAEQLVLGAWQHLERGAPGVARGGSVFIVDMAKANNIAPRVAAQLQRHVDTLGLPQEYANVVRFASSGEGVRPNFNLLTPIGSNNMLDQISMAADVLSILVSDPAAYDTYKKFIKMAMVQACEDAGWDMRTGTPLVPGSKPPIPTPAMITKCIKEVIASEEYQGEIKANVGAYTKTTFESLLLGTPSYLFTDGHEFDWAGFVDNPGAKVAELGAITDEGVQKVAMASLFYGLSNYLKSCYPDGDTDDLALTIILDEAALIFDDSPAGRMNARYLALVRGFGISVWIATQGNLESLNGQVGANTLMTIALRTGNQADIAAIAGRMGEPAESLKELTTMPAGEGLFFGENADAGPIRVRTKYDENLPAGRVLTPEEAGVIRLGPNRYFYMGAEVAAAEKMLADTPEGLGLRLAADLNVPLQILGLPTISFGPRLRQELNEHEARVVSCAIDRSTDRSATGRPEIMQGLDREKLVTYLRDRAHADAAGELERPANHPEDARLDLTADIGYYGPIKAALEDRMRAPALGGDEDSAMIRDAYEAVLGPMPGITIQEQLASVQAAVNASAGVVARIIMQSQPQPLGNLEQHLHRAAMTAANAQATAEQEAALAAGVEERVQQTMDLKHASVRGLARQILADNLRTRYLAEAEQQKAQALAASLEAMAAAGPPLLTEAQFDEIIPHIARLVGGSRRLEEGVTRAINEVEKSLHRTLNERERSAFEQVVQRIGPDAALEVGYETMRTHLQQIEEEYRATAPPLDNTSHWEAVYDEDLPGVSAQEQYQKVLEREKDLLAPSKQKINITNLFFAKGVEEAGFGIDNIMTAVSHLSNPHTQTFVYKAVSAALHGGNPPAPGLVGQVVNDPDNDDWAAQLATFLLYNEDYFDIPPSTLQFLVNFLSDEVTKVRDQVNRHRQAEARRSV